MRLPAVLSVALLAVASLKAEAPPLQGTLPEDLLPGLKPLLQTAVERSPNTLAAIIGVETAEATKLAAFSGLYPSVTGNLNYAINTVSETNSTPNTTKGFYYGAGVNQAIFQWGAVRNAALVGSLGLKIADRQYAEAYRQLAYLVREQYMTLIEKNIQFRNDSFKERIAEEDFAAQEARFESGASSQAMLQTVQLSREDAKLARDKSEDGFEYSKQQFIRLVGINDLPDKAIPSEIPHPEFSADLADAVLSGFVGNGIESTFQSQVYQLELKQHDLNYSIAKVRLLPKVSATANYSYSNITTPSAGSVTQFGVQQENYGLSAYWDIFDGFATRGAKLGELAAKRSVALQLKGYTDSTIDSINEMRHQLGFSARAMSMAEIHNALIDAQVRRLNDDKTLGFASQASIDTGMLTLYSTQFDQAYARGDYLSRWTEFISLAGLDPAIDNISPSYVR